MPLGQVAGVRVRVHPLFLAILAAAVLGGQGRAALILLFLLLTHELAHLLVARAYGLEVAEVDLLPFGGVARVEGLREAEPAVEAAVAVAGPLNNLLLLAAGVLAARAGWAAGPEARLFLDGNLALALFNLLPALPLDGGRCWRSLLVPRWGYARATRALARAGQAVALALAAAGTLALLWELFVPNAFALALLLYPAAGRELAASGWEPLQFLWRRADLLRARRVLPVQELAVLEDVPVREVVRHLGGGRYCRLRVLDRRLRLLGELDEAELLAALARHGAAVRVGDLVRR